ncbi:hypothetical protein GCM10022236_35190 [Microlunatus ginsengisoli]|uniref:Phage integrase family protein n=1 Tax=Microlunatus ginsengisoli TaxID=363863 RepID=A0ABP7ACW5_9ACTN
MRHSSVSLSSDAGIPIEEIARLVGHRGTTVTELVYRHQLRAVIQTGASVMDRLFSSEFVQDRSHAVSHSGAEDSGAEVGENGSNMALTGRTVAWSQGDSNP